MRILTIVRMVPDSQATIRVAPDGLSIESQHDQYICDPFDEFGVEQAVRLKESRGDVEEVVALTLGAAAPNIADKALRYALAMGADRGIYICFDENDPPEPHDELHQAHLVSSVIGNSKRQFDLILTGKQSIDNDAGEFGPALAELLDWPHIGAIIKLEVAEDGSNLLAHRRIEGGHEVVESSVPALFTCEKGQVEPRYPALPNIIKAKKKPVEFVTSASLALVENTNRGSVLVKLSPPAARPACRMIEGKPEQMARELVRLLRDETKVV